MRETDLATLGEILEKLTVSVEDHREEKASAQQKNTERQAKIEVLRAQRLDDGIDPSEFLNSVSTNKSKIKT